MVGFFKFSTADLHELAPKDIAKYVAIAVIGLLGIAGVLQSIHGSSSSTYTTPNRQTSNYRSVYGQ